MTEPDNRNEKASFIKRARRKSGRRLSPGKLLESLDKKQLTKVILDTLQRYPSFNDDILALIPQPSVQHARESLLAMEKRLMQSIPYSRSGPARDDYAYFRVQPVINELKESILEYADHFSNEEHPSIQFEYLLAAFEIIGRLPKWNNPAHNLETMELYEQLADQCLDAVQTATLQARNGRIFGSQAVKEWAILLEKCNGQSSGAFDQVLKAFEDGLGWIITH